MKKKNGIIMKANGNMEIQILWLIFLVSATQTPTFLRREKISK